MDPGPSCRILEEVSDMTKRPGPFQLMDYTKGREPTVMYFSCKKETFQLRKNYRKFQRFLKTHLGCTVIPLDSDLTDGLLPFCNLVVIGGMNECLSDVELGLLFDYVQHGGSVLVLGESTQNFGLYNDLTRHFGIKLINDSIISVIRHKQYLPKQCFIPEAMICPTLLPGGSPVNLSVPPPNINIVYPFGCTLTVQTALAAPIISSGSSSFPSNRPLGAIFYSKESNGRVIVFGSGHAFTDEFIGKEDNTKLLGILLDVLVAEEKLDLEVCDGNLIFNDDLYCTEKKSGRFRGMMENIEQHLFPGMDLFNRQAIKPVEVIPRREPRRLRYSMLTDVLIIYDHLELDRKALTQVKPVLERGLFTPKLAVFPPSLRRINQEPPLELYDLDEEFSTVETKLGRLCNKCKDDDDMEYCIEAMGDLLNVKVPKGSVHRAKAVLFEMFRSLATFKTVPAVHCGKGKGSDSDVTQVPSGVFNPFDKKGSPAESERQKY